MNVLGDAEFVLLYSPQNLHLPCDLYPYFDLQNLLGPQVVTSPEVIFHTFAVPEPRRSAS